jgi:hypothetical protein
MQRESKVQLSKMMSLMERMDKHYTNDQAKILLENDLRNKHLLIENIGEADDHELTDDRFKDYVGKIQKGWQVHVGYVTTEELGLSRSYPTQGSYDYLASKLSAGTGEKFKDYLGTSMEDMKNFLENPGKRKSFEFPLKENYEIIKFQEYSISWMNTQAIAEFYQALGDKELELRRNSGFGEPGAENTWRNKSTIYKSGKNAGKTKYIYGGPNVNPIVNPGTGGNTFKQANAEDGMQDSWKDPLTGKNALRQIPVKYGEPRFFLHDLNDGTYEEVSKEIVNALAYKFKQPKVEQELEADEKQFVTALAEITKEKSTLRNLLEEKCLFISYTLKMPDGTKKPKRLINYNLKDELEPIIDTLGLRGRLTDSL